ncbi:MAG TPA: entericidin A/B family lipoprotein [Burkholderiales bacterium]|nr:entericidin A/B family lipoprotein [Burkholderiales bacterium]
MRTFALLIAAVLVLCACNTMRGFGKDVETAGEAIQRKSTR